MNFYVDIPRLSSEDFRRAMIDLLLGNSDLPDRYVVKSMAAHTYDGDELPMESRFGPGQAIHWSTKLYDREHKLTGLIVKYADGTSESTDVPTLLLQPHSAFTVVVRF